MIKALTWAVGEMDKRYNVFLEASVLNIKEYKSKLYKELLFMQREMEWYIIHSIIWTVLVGS